MKTSFLALAFLAAASLAHAAAGFQNGQPAIGVIGQADFKSGDPYPADSSTAAKPNRFVSPQGVAYDAESGKVFVCDAFNHRVLRFADVAAAESGEDPEMVFGQPDFTSHSSLASSASHITIPGAIAVDAKERLWVADTGSHRVVGYFKATTTLVMGPAADIVLGQSTVFGTQSGLAKDRMDAPYAVAVGPDDTLWVADTGNNRVLAFANVSAKKTGDPADGVLGQPSFGAKTPAFGPGGMSSPLDICADAAGRLWVADTFNDRVLRFDNAIAKARAAIPTVTNAKADGVLGQKTFFANTQALDGTHVNKCYGVCLDAAGTLWVSDNSFAHILGFPAAAALLPAAPATYVLGQPDFKTGDPGLSDKAFGPPWRVAGGPAGSLYVADRSNNRVLRFAPVEIVAPPAVARPVVKISGAKKLTTAKAKLTVKGKATGQVASVTYRIGGKPARKAKGTASWKFTAALRPGPNKITVTAIGTGSTGGPGGPVLNSAPAKLTIIRKP